MDKVKVNKQVYYDFASPDSDPWYEASFLAYYGAPKTWNFNIALDNYVLGLPLDLDCFIVGITDWPADPDHHTVLKFNGKWWGTSPTTVVQNTRLTRNYPWIWRTKAPTR